MTIIEAINWGSNFLRNNLHEKFTDRHRPQVDAAFLLAHTLGASQATLLAHGNEVLLDEEFEQYRKLILRRYKHEPVSQIIGKVNFCGNEICVNRHVLTPRPETEELVELILKKGSYENLMEVGTGSGAIAISLAKSLNRQVLATEIDQLSLAVAKKNAQLNRVEHLIQFELADLIPNTFQKNRVTIVANLPYIPKRDRREMDPDVRLFEPNHALFSGHDGLDEIERLWRVLNNRQIMNIDLWLEIDPTQEQKIGLFAKGVEFFKDLRGLTRFARIKK
jgi:release factor glutamine methyltransferase